MNGGKVKGDEEVLHSGKHRRELTTDLRYRRLPIDEDIEGQIIHKMGKRQKRDNVGPFHRNLYLSRIKKCSHVANDR